MKRCFALAAALVLLLCACNQPASSSSAAGTPAASGSGASLAASQGETPQPKLDYAAEPPLDETALAAAVPDFLTGEQQLLYRRAYAIFGAFEGNAESIESFPLADGTPYARTLPAETIKIEGRSYCKAEGRYSNYEDFEGTSLQLFTPEYFEELKGTRFLNIDDGLYYTDAARGSNFGYMPKEMPDTFELVSLSEDAVTFNLIGHYYVDGYEEGVQRTEYTTASFPITLVRQGVQWRFTEFHAASQAETYGRMSEVKTWSEG